MTRRISIDPITRLEGHGKIEIFLDDDGAVEDCHFQIPELRGFERFVEGRPIEELPRIVTRICGVCPASHHMASAKAVDGCFGNECPELAHKLRDMYYNAHYIHSHIAHFYALAAPDFVCGPDSEPAMRNILGVVDKVGLEIGGAVIKARAMAQEIQMILGGRFTHLVWCLPGGVAKGCSKEDLEKIKPMVAELYDFTQFSLQLFRDVVLGNEGYVDLIVNGPYTLDVHNMGLVDENNAPNFYDGKVRVVDYEGKEIVKYAPNEYMNVVAEHVEPWSYLKFPYLKERGWKGFVEGIDTSLYCATPLSRLNVADRMATPKAQEAHDEMYTTLGGKPVKAQLAQHWARLVEMVQNAETLQMYCDDPEITGDGYRVVPAADHRRGRRHRRGHARHADPPLHLRRERHVHERQPHRRHDQQQRPHPHDDEAGGQHPDQAGRRARPGHPQHGGDGVQGLRPVLQLRDAQPARRDAPRGADHQGRRAVPRVQAQLLAAGA